MDTLHACMSLLISGVALSFPALNRYSKKVFYTFSVFICGNLIPLDVFSRDEVRFLSRLLLHLMLGQEMAFPNHHIPSHK